MEPTRDSPDEVVRDHDVRKGEHEKDGGVKNNVSLPRVLTHGTHVDSMALRDPGEQHRHALVADVRIWTGALLSTGRDIGIGERPALRRRRIGTEVSTVGESVQTQRPRWLGGNFTPTRLAV